MSAEVRMRDDLRHTIELGAGAGIVALLTLVYVLGMGRLLGPRHYADFSAALSIFQFVAVALSPLAPTTSRLVARSIVRGESSQIAGLSSALRRAVLRWSAIAAIPLLLGLIPLSRAFRFASPVTVAIALASAALFTNVSIRRAVLQGLGQFRQHNVNTIIEAALRLALAISILYVFPTPTGALAAYLAALLIADLLLRSRDVPASDTKVNWADVRELIAPLVIAMTGVAVFQYSGLLVVKRWFDAADAGQYGAASTLAGSISILFVPIYTLAGPLLTDLHERGRSLLPATLRLCGYFLAMAAVPVILFSTASNQVVTLLYGSEFLDAGPLLWPLAALAVLMYLNLILGQALITVGDRRFGPVYLTFAILHLIAIVMARHSFDTIILAQYVVQGALSLVMVFLMMGLRGHAKS